MGIELRLESQGDSATVYCIGEIRTGDDGRRLRAEVANSLQTHRLVIVDLSNVRYMDSCGLGILVSLYSIARTASATLKYENLVARVDYSNPPRHDELTRVAS